MTRYVVDTNVPIVANGRSDEAGARPPTINCRIAAIGFLQTVLERGKVLIDLEGAIQGEYRTYLHASGQPGVGDRFYQEILNSAPRLIQRVELPRRDDGEYADLPDELIAARFDPSDRKFAALAAREKVPVVNATDSDWADHQALLEKCGIRIRFVCGCDKSTWFEG